MEVSLLILEFELDYLSRSKTLSSGKEPDKLSLECQSTLNKKTHNLMRTCVWSSEERQYEKSLNCASVMMSKVESLIFWI